MLINPMKKVRSLSAIMTAGFTAIISASVFAQATVDQVTAEGIKRADAGAAEQHVVAATAVDFVVARAAVDQVVATAAFDVVVPGTAAASFAIASGVSMPMVKDVGMGAGLGRPNISYSGSPRLFSPLWCHCPSFTS